MVIHQNANTLKKELIVAELDLNNFGTLKNNNNTSNLYSFYTLNKDPKEKQSKAYLKFYDENLNETNKIGFELNPKTNIFLEITDNNQNVVVENAQGWFQTIRRYLFW